MSTYQERAMEAERPKLLTLNPERVDWMPWTILALAFGLLALVLGAGWVSW